MTNFMKETLTAVADRIMAGYRLQKDDAIVQEMLTLPLEDLQREAGRLQKHFCGNHVDFCTIINARSGRCGENCKYCAQAACHHTDCEEYGFLPKEEIMKVAKADQDAGANRFSLVTSGRALTGKDFEKALDTYQEMHKTLTIDLCASHGILSQEQFHRLVQTGVTSYHHNIETSRRNFPNICTTHTYEKKIETLKLVKAEGMCACSGGIIGMGETWEDRLDMAVSLAELEIDSIPINALMPIPGTPLEGLPQLSEADILRTIAFFRYLNPEANIRLAAGRALLTKDGETAFQAGASATITGNMLTTVACATIRSDRAMLEGLGRDVTPDYWKEA